MPASESNIQEETDSDEEENDSDEMKEEENVEMTPGRLFCDIWHTLKPTVRFDLPPFNRRDQQDNGSSNNIEED